VVALSRADAVDESARRDIEDRARRLAPQAIWMEITHRPARLISASSAAIPLTALKNQPVAAFCGIGNPAGFRHTLTSCGLKITGQLELPDHCSYDGRRLA